MSSLQSSFAEQGYSPKLNFPTQGCNLAHETTKTWNLTTETQTPWKYILLLCIFPKIRISQPSYNNTTRYRHLNEYITKGSTTKYLKW